MYTYILPNILKERERHRQWAQQDRILLIAHKGRLRLLDGSGALGTEVRAWFRQWDMGQARLPTSSKSIYHQRTVVKYIPHDAEHPKIEKRYSQLCS